MLHRPVRVRVEEEFPGSILEMWDLLGNTDHLNRTISLPSIDFENPDVSAGDFFRMASAKYFGITLRWKEYPFNWVRGESYSVLRAFSKGPVEKIEGGIELEPGRNGTRVKVFADITPRFPWGLLRPFFVLAGRKNVGGVLNYCRKYTASVARGIPDPIPRLPGARPSSRALARLTGKVLKETPAAPEVVAAIERLVREGSDDEVLHMRPFALADQWGQERDHVLRTFLYSTFCGLLELDWKLMCPNCRVPKAESRTLAELGNQFHCDLCGTNFQADLDRTTELRFSCHPSVRTAEDSTYCIGGPMNSPHILAQRNLPAGQEHFATLNLPAEPLRARVLRVNRTALLDPDPEGGSELELTYTNQGWKVPQQRFRPGPVTVHWKNEGDAIQVAVVEKMEWDDSAVTAVRVTAMKEFRTLFSAEVLAPGQEIGIRCLCLLFTDLKGSTALYEKVGDAPAYGRVRRHFDFLTECFERHEGGIVKTIGDAVMASFTSPVGALRGALEVQQRIDGFNRELGLAEPIVIKIGLHSGAAIAVNANGSVDYFGRVVNIAARVQGESEGGDIVMTRETYNDPEIQEVLREVSIRAEPFVASLKGIEERMVLCRVWVGPEGGGAP